MGLIDRRPTGLLRLVLRAPLLLFRAGLGRLTGDRLLYLAHRGRLTGRRREAVLEVVRFDPARPEAVVVAAWGGEPDWYRNLLTGPAIEVRISGRRWPHPVHRLLDSSETFSLLSVYRKQHPGAWRRIAPLLGFPVELTPEDWQPLSDRIHAVAFTPRPPAPSTWPRPDDPVPAPPAA